MSAAAAPAVKFTYFNGRGLGEVARLCLHAGGVSFTDERIEQDAWAALKSAQPYGQMPVLTVGEKKIAQSGSIVRYIARHHGLQGANDCEQTSLDSAWEAVNDIRVKGYQAKSSKDEAKMAEFVAAAPAAFALLEKNAGEHSGHFAGNKISYVDIAIYYLLFQLATEKADLIEAVKKDNPKLKAIAESVEKNEKIAAYLKVRAVTPW